MLPTSLKSPITFDYSVLEIGDEMWTGINKIKILSVQMFA